MMPGIHIQYLMNHIHINLICQVGMECQMNIMMHMIL